MHPHPQIKTYYVFFMTLPAGLSQGFVSVTLPYILTHHGYTVAQAASVVALGLSANAWRFLWGPIVDVSLSLKKWYWISLLLCTASLLWLCYSSFSVQEQGLVTLLAFVSQVAGTFMLLPVSGLMSKCIDDRHRGRASGWFQAGSLVGVGIGGGAGLWFATHYTVPVAGLVLCMASVLFALVMFWLQDVPHEKTHTLRVELAGMGKDILAMLKVPLTLLVIFLILMPIGTGAASNLWSAIATDWNTDADTVALVTGVLSGFVSAIGCLVGGLVIDKWGNWVGYLGSGLVCALITLTMAMMPMAPYVYIAGVLAYMFGIGLINAAFTSIILYAVGKRNVATKYSLLASLGNVPVIYMTAFDGWAHDQYNSKYMLLAEAFAGVLCVLIFFVLLRAMMSRKLIPVAVVAQAG